MTTIHRITVAIRDLHNALKNAMLFTVKRPNQQLRAQRVDCVHLAIRRGRLLMEATDTFKMVQIDVSQCTTCTVDGQPNGQLDDQSLGVIVTEDIKVLEAALRDDAKIKADPLLPLVELVVDRDKEHLDVYEAQSVEPEAQVIASMPMPAESLGYDIDEVFERCNQTAGPAVLHRVFDPNHLKVVTAVSDTRAAKKDQTAQLMFAAEGEPVFVHWRSGPTVWAQGAVMPVAIEGGHDVHAVRQF